ncbi:MAG: GNAT family N-acetyltransferase [Flexilinea sp.]
MLETISAITIYDQHMLEDLILRSFCVHEHLDWLQINDILSDGFCYVLNNQNRQEAVLAISKNAPDIYWIHFFISMLPVERIQETWHKLFSYANNALGLENALTAAIPTNITFEQNIITGGFRIYENIIFLEAHNLKFNDGVFLPEEFTTRNFLYLDIEKITQLCEKTFPPLWKLSSKNIQNAVQQSDYAIILETDHKICGYLLASQENGVAHLSRIAIDPEFQTLGLGTCLLKQMINHYLELGIEDFTVNTPSKNKTAISFYQKNGFQITGSSFPVYFFGNKYTRFKTLP